VHRQNGQTQRGKKPKSIVGRCIYIASALAYLYISSSLLIFDGPFTELRKYAVDTLSNTRHAYLLKPMSLFTVSEAEIKQHSQNWIVSKNVQSTKATRNYSAVHDSGIQVVTVKTSRFTANIMLIRDPNRIHVAVTKHLGSTGQTVADMVADAHAVAGVNGGSFNDTHFQGTGGIPMGTVVSNGKYLQVGADSPLIGITGRGQLVCGMYTEGQMRAMGIKEALSFGPILVQNGAGVAPKEGGWDPRTAIGQKVDGTIIFIVTDGRSLKDGKVGATFQDVQDLMMKYGAYTAANLDGGSSVQMLYNGKLVNHPSDILGARYVATSFIVMP
jgi:exopolysaccharide biosynthesis protein